MFRVFTRDSRYEDASELIRSRILKGDEIFMCSIAEALEKKGYEKGYEIGYEIGYKEGLEIGLKAIVHSLKEFLLDFSSICNAIIRNEYYRDVTEEQVRKYYS